MSPSQATALTILVVDDEVELLSEIARHLRRRGHNVLTADSYVGGQALIDDAVNPDVLITDVRMPGGNGLDLARRARERHARCRIVVITGHLDRSQIGMAKEAGAATVLFKPFSCSKLLETVMADAAPTAPVPLRRPILATGTT